MAFLTQAANRGSVATGYDIDNSIKFEADNTESFGPKVFSSDGNRKTFTTSMWVKRTKLGQASSLFGTYPTSGANNNNVFQFGFTADDKFQCGLQTYYVVQTNRKFRDTAAWYHIVVRVDTTRTATAEKWRLYINGVEETSFAIDARSSIGTNQDLGANYSSTRHYVVAGPAINNWYYSGYMAEIHHVDGQSLEPTAFGEFDADSGIWKPKAYFSSHGTNGFYFDIKDASGLADDKSGNSHDFASQGGAPVDQATDTPTNNFCTMNNNSRTNGNIRTQEGGTQVTADGGSGWVSMNATMGVQAGKWYWEVRYENTSDANNVMVGIAASDDPYIPNKTGGYYLGNVATTGSHGWLFKYSTVYNMSGTWSDLSAGDIAMVALDCDNGKLYFGVNGTWKNSSNPATNTNGGNYAGYQNAVAQQVQDSFMIPSVSLYQGKRIKFMNFGGHTGNPISSAESDANGYGTFEYTPPSGFYSLCTKNLAEFG